MSVLTSEIPSDNESMAITESTNKRKFEEIDSIVKKYRVQSPTTSPFTPDTDADPSEGDQSNSILSDVAENESTDSSEPNDKPETPETFNNHSPGISDDSNDAKNEKSEGNSSQISCPQFGQIVNRREFRRAGPYIIGLKLGGSPVDSIVQYLAKKENTNEFVQLKVRSNYFVEFRLSHQLISIKHAGSYALRACSCIIYKLKSGL